jgi:Xaa-Pro aminopeptidase
MPVMKKDLDSLMAQQNIDLLFVVGPGFHNPVMAYLTGCAPLTQAIVIKKKGEEPVLFYRPMERDQAAQTGLQAVNLNHYPLGRWFKKTNGAPSKSVAYQYQAILSDMGFQKGRVLLYGVDEVGTNLSVFSELQKLMPGLEFVADVRQDPIQLAMATKDTGELDHILQMGRVTVDVVANIADYLSGFSAGNEILSHVDGSPVTIGEVKQRIDLLLAERGAENPEGTIFSMGRDAGVPHNNGRPDAPLRLGQTIVFDIYPCEAKGGYFYDFTRTWCLGYAPDNVQKIYDQVKQVYQQLTRELQVDTPFAFYNQRACQMFETQGHATILTQPDTEAGFVHSLGHGVGLHIHEKPWSGLTANPTDVLAPGTVFTLEPGLYYPEQGLGVRLEDTWMVKPDGSMEIFVDFPKELVLPVKK